MQDDYDYHGNKLAAEHDEELRRRVEDKKKSKWRKKILCDWLAWHSVRDIDFVASNAFQIKATCRLCGKKVMLDSQGNWF